MAVEASMLKEESILDPSGRLRRLSEIGSSVIVDHEVPIQRYLRSGPQMERMVSGRGFMLMLIVSVARQRHTMLKDNGNKRLFYIISLQRKYLIKTIVSGLSL